MSAGACYAVAALGTLAADPRAFFHAAQLLATLGARIAHLGADNPEPVAWMLMRVTTEAVRILTAKESG
ncbi:hypothetical protein [Nitrosospira multiformis]|uniref:hypothetical protein n=1 Tax=Nitrosospira multiformis TaxID=1231 RepID=UPI0015A51C58|nr:hypothetical protein [Nitrosospira multiformis]